ncbi:MAG: endospore germination permease [Clostridia bacterium]|nr:endospore germination permease [Clostridia bacterium]
MEKLSHRQLCGIGIIIIISGILVSGGGNRSMQDAWIAAGLSLILALPLYLLYARITALYPGKGLFDIIYICFGKVVGGIITGILCLYTLQIGSMSMRIFSEFNQVVSMPQTSQVLMLIFFIVPCIYIMKKGIAVLGRVTNLVLPVIIFLIMIIYVMSLKDWNTENIMPILAEADGRFISDAFTCLVYPFGEVFLISVLFAHKKYGKKGYGVYLWALVIGGGVFVLETLRAIMVLGTHTNSILYYPSYTAAGVINIMDFFTRIEVIVSGSFFVAQILKVSLCLYVISLGLSKILNTDSGKVLIAPIAVFMTALATIIFENTISSYRFLSVYKFYAPFFQVLIPFLIWIVAEFKHRRFVSA